MIETSNSRVTITLGRNGQVVKRAGTDSYLGSLPTAGNKRSVRDRLGNGVDSYSLQGSKRNNKRLRSDGNMSASRSNDIDDIRISKDDLRFRLMQKKMSRLRKRDGEKRIGDLREKLSRTAQPSPRSVDPRQRAMELKETRILRQIPSTRSADDMLLMGSSRNSYSPWTLDKLRRRSPNGTLGSYRGHSPPRDVRELQRRPLNRTFDDVRSIQNVMSKDVPDTSRHLSAETFVTKPTYPTRPGTTMTPVPSQLPPPSGILHKTSLLVQEHQSVESVLNSLGLGKFAILFKAEEVDMTALKQMGENDLKELGIPMGPRKKIMLAVNAPTKMTTLRIER